MHKQTKLTRLHQKMAWEMLDKITKKKEMSELNPNISHCNPCMAKEVPKLTDLKKLLPQEMAQDVQRMKEKELNPNLCQCNQNMAKEMTKLTRPAVHLFTHYSPSLYRGLLPGVLSSTQYLNLCSY